MIQREPNEYRAILARVEPPTPVHNASLESEEITEVRKVFFEEVRTALERKLSRGAIESCTTVEYISSPPRVGDEVDISYELWLKDRFPLAFALETQENHEPTVRFGVYPPNRKTTAALRSLEEADRVYTDIIFRS